jgi:hypothetical protein
VTLCADIAYINGVPFLVTISRRIKFATVQELAKQNDATILAALHKVVKIYQAGGMPVKHALLDGRFESLKERLSEIGVSANITSRDEHVGDIERFIRTVKERVRGIYNTLPFHKMPRTLVVEMAKFVIFWWNAFPVADGISNNLSPSAIVVGRHIDYNRHCRFEFAEYVQTWEEHDNSMQPRTIGALALRPTGNLQGSYYFYSLSTGRIIRRQGATKVPMPADVIDRVHAMASRVNESTVEHIDDDDEEDDNNVVDLTDDGDDDEGNDDDDNDDNPDDEGGHDEVRMDDDGVQAEMDARYGPRNGRYNLRPRRLPEPQVPNIAAFISVQGCDEGVNLITVEDGEDDEMYATPQVNLRQGLEMFGEEGVDAVRQEMKQLHDRKVMKPQERKCLTPEQRREA